MLGFDEASFRTWLRLRKASVPRGRPREPREQAVLASPGEWQAAIADARRLGLPLHADPPRTWDTLLALSTILRRVPPSARVLDVAGEPGATLLPSLALYGFEELTAIEPAPGRGPVDGWWRAGDRGPWPDGWFDAVASLGALEPRDVGALLAEAARLLRRGGVLVLSADYWPVRDDGERGGGGILTRAELVDLVAQAAGHGLWPSSPIGPVLARLPDERSLARRRGGPAHSRVLLTLCRVESGARVVGGRGPGLL